MIRIKRAVVAAAAFGLALSIVAAQPEPRKDGRRDVHFGDPIVVQGTEVPKGWYTLSWTRDGGSDEVRVRVSKGRKVLAETKGLWVHSKNTSTQEAVAYDITDGTNHLAEIRFERSTESIVVGPEAIARYEESHGSSETD